jgi:signal peptidase II
MGKWRVFLLVVLAGIAADQATKFMAVDRLTTALARGDGALSARVTRFYQARNLEAWSTEPHVVWAPMWRMRYAENRAAAFGMLNGVPAGLRIPLFGLLNLVAATFITLFVRRLGPGQRLLAVPLGMVLAGALSNYLDRLTHGYVVDFVDWHWWNRPDLYWPTFNLADSLIVVGVGLLMLLPGEPPKKSA